MVFYPANALADPLVALYYHVSIHWPILGPQSRRVYLEDLALVDFVLARALSEPRPHVPGHGSSLRLLWQAFAHCVYQCRWSEIPGGARPADSQRSVFFSHIPRWRKILRRARSWAQSQSLDQRRLSPLVMSQFLGRWPFSLSPGSGPGAHRLSMVHSYVIVGPEVAFPLSTQSQVFLGLKDSSVPGSIR